MVVPFGAITRTGAELWCWSRSSWLVMGSVAVARGRRRLPAPLLVGTSLGIDADGIGCECDRTVRLLPGGRRCVHKFAGSSVIGCASSKLIWLARDVACDQSSRPRTHRYPSVQRAGRRHGRDAVCDLRGGGDVIGPTIAVAACCCHVLQSPPPRHCSPGSSWRDVSRNVRTWQVAMLVAAAAFVPAALPGEGRCRVCCGVFTGQRWRDIVSRSLRCRPYRWP